MHIAEILRRHRGELIAEWIDRLRDENGPRYQTRPKEELYITVAAAFDASYAVLVERDYKLIDCHIRWITGLRLLGGFSLSEVQGAYEMFRKIVTPVLAKELGKRELKGALERVNECLYYTITRFSDNFQQLHEKQIREHAQDLKEQVDKRTRELAESEAQYRVLVEDINDGYFVNQDGTIVFANKAFCDLHDYSVAEVIGRPYIDFIATESRGEVKKLYEKRVEIGYAQDLYVYSRRTRDGRALPTENKVKLIVYRGKAAVAGICRDITERIEMEKKVRESESLAHIGQLTTSLAHEIRNPLSSVKMNIQILLKKLEFSGNDKRRMEIMTGEISRLERILSEMLDFAKPLRLNLKPASVRRVITSCLEIMTVRFQEKGIEVRRKFSRSIPNILVDQDKIEQAIINVLQNSIDAVPAHGWIGITTRYAPQSTPHIEITIDDNGPGISQEDLPYVFDPFFSNKKKGTGLGLWNVKKVIEAHGGSVGITTKRTGGVHLSMAIPVGGA
jgi:PAS domain S-box-containing protein